MKLNQSWTILVYGVCCVTTLESWSWNRLWWFTHDAWIVNGLWIHSNLGMRQLGPPSLQKIKPLGLSTYSEHEVYLLYIILKYIDLLCADIACRSSRNFWFQLMIRYCTSCLCIYLHQLVQVYVKKKSTALLQHAHLCPTAVAFEKSGMAEGCATSGRIGRIFAIWCAFG